jgi:glycerol uptake facilitator-like aquaporin
MRWGSLEMGLSKKLFAEFLGTAGLLAIIVGSGIMGESLAGGNVAVALLANTLATSAGLAFLILSFGEISGAHFNPAVTLTEAWRSNMNWREVPFYILCQILGAFFGVGIANLMFELPAFSASTKIRAGNAQFLSEFVATFGLIAVIQTGIKFRPNLVFLMVAAYITSAYWFTSSTSFANPAVTLARSLSNTFAGINPSNVPMFLVAQFLGAFVATIIFSWLLRENEENG